VAAVPMEAEVAPMAAVAFMVVAEDFEAVAPCEAAVTAEAASAARDHMVEARTEAACMAAHGRSAEALAPTVAEDIAAARPAVPAVTLHGAGPRAASAKDLALAAAPRLVRASQTATCTPSAVLVVQPVVSVAHAPA